MSKRHTGFEQHWSEGGRTVLETGVLGVALLVVWTRMPSLSLSIFEISLLLGAVAGVRTPGDLSRRVAVGLLAWSLVAIALLALARAGTAFSGLYWTTVVNE